MANHIVVALLGRRLEQRHEIDEKLSADALLTTCRAALIQADGGEDDAHELEAHRLRAELVTAYAESGYVVSREEGEPAYYVNALRVIARRLNTLSE